MKKIYNLSNMSVMVAKWSRNYKLLLFTLFALGGLFGVNESAWALRYGKAIAHSSPAAGGWVWVTKTDGNAPSSWEKTDDESSDDNTKIKDWTFPFYYYANAQTNYTFLGWASSSATNTTVSTTRTNWYVGVTATSANNVNWKYATAEYWALFGRLTASSTATMAFGTKLNGSGWNTGTTKSVTINYVHAGNITATISGTNSTEFSLSSSSSSQSKAVVSGNTDSESSSTITVYFNPSTAGNKSATLTISSNTGLESISISLTGTGQATINPTYSSTIADSYYVEDASLNLANLWTSTSPATRSYSIKANSWKPDVVNEAGATAPAISGSTLSLGQAGTLTIKVSQEATTGYYAGSAEKTITIKKRDNEIKVNNSTSYAPTMYVDATLNNIVMSATNTSYTNCPITVSQKSGSEFVSLSYTQSTRTGVATSNHKLGKATWNVHQDGNYKYKEGNGTFSVEVKKASEATDCYVKTDLNTEHKFSDSWETTWNEDNAAGTLRFEASAQAAWTYGLNVYQLIDGNWSFIEYIDHDHIHMAYTQYSYQLNQRAKGVKFEQTGTLNRWVQNVYVTRASYLNAENLTIDKTKTNNPVYPSDGTGVGTLTIDYSIANGGDLKIANDNSKFTLDKTIISNVDCKTGTATITISYESDEAGTDVAHLVIYNDVYRKEVTITGITSKRTQVVNWEIGDVVRLGSETENAAWVISGNTVSYSSSDPSIIDVVDGKLVAKAVGSATITATADGNGDYEDASDTKTIAVTNDEIQWIEWNQTFLRLKVGGSNVTLEASAQSDVEGCTTDGARPITYSSTNESVVRIDNNTKQLVIVGAGTTVITATQAGGTDKDGHKYMAVSQEKTVIVRDPSTPCVNYLYIQPTENEWYCGWNHLNRQYKEFVIENLLEPSDISLQYKGEYKRVALTDYFYGKIHVEEWYDNAWHDLTDGGLDPAIGNYQTFSHALNRNTTKVRISTHDGVGYHYFKDCKIGQSRYIETNTLDAYEAKVGQTVNQILSISYDNIVGDITLALGHKESNFSISQNVITGDCGDRATVDITVSYTPQAATGNEGEAETLTITDDETTKEITLHGSATVTERYILWDIPETNDKFTVESVELTAAALTKVGNNPAGEVFYSLGGLSTTGTINEDDAILTFAKDGIAYVSAEGKTSASYNTPAAVTKTFNVSKTPTTVDELPTAGTIYGGTAANDVVLTGGSAKNTVNNGAVTGLFKVTSPATLNAGTHDLTIEFTPENKDMYIGFTTTLKDVTVSQITPEAGQLGVKADDITCGQRIDEAILNNTGSLAGRWYWVDEEANHATPVAGTYDDLNVYFVPSNTNYATVNSTVSVKVNKLETLNVPVALSFCAGESETFRGTEYTEAGEYNVPATGLTRDTVYNVTVTVLQPTTGTDSKTITYGDSESWNGIDLSGYAVGSHEVEYHTTNAVGCDSTVTLTLTVNAPIINEYIGTGDWNEDENWSSGSKPDPKEENPDIIVTGTLVVKDTISVGSLTIKPTGGVVIIDKGVLVVNDATPEQNDGYGDLRVADDGALQLNEELKVRDFTLDAKLGDNDSNPAASGQVSGDEKLNVNGDAYFKMSFDITGQITYGWYDFVVPFEVDAMNGVFDANGVKIVYGTDYIIMSHSEEKRARNQKAWNTFTGTLEPGRIYTITFEETKTWNTFLFKKKAGSDLVNSGTYTSDYSSTIGEIQDRGWNGFGNGTLQHRELINLTGISKVQMYNHTYNRYDVVDNAEWTTKALAVGTAFSIQVGSAQSVVLEEANAAKPLRAPRYSDSRTIEEFYLKLTDSDTERTADRLWVSASEEATGEYVIGRDLLKMGTPTQAKAVQIWAINNNMTLCDIEMQLVSEEASCALGLFAPKAGSYELKIERAPEDANLYLTYNGEIIWDLTASPYMFDLSKGTTNGYGLRIEVQAPQMPTGIEESEFSNQSSVRKVLIDNKVYIVTPEGKMYNIIGKGVKF